MWITQLLSSPVFESEDKTRVARLLNWILLTIFGVNLIDVLLLAIFAPETLPTFWLNGLLFVVTAISFWMMRRGRVAGASLVLLAPLWLLLIYYLPKSGGVASPAFGFLNIIIIGGGVLLGARAAAGIGLLCMGTAIVLYWAGTNEWLTSIEGPPTLARLFATQSTIVLSLTILMIISRRNVQDALTRARRARQELSERNRDLEREIAQRQQAEEAYRVLVEHSLQGLVIFQDNRIVFANPAIARTVGRSVDELLALDDPFALIHPDDRAFIAENLPGLSSEETAEATYEFGFIRADGQVRFAESSAVAITYRGKPAVQSTTVDITERKQAEEQLRLSEERYRVISQIISDYAFSCRVDPDGTWTLEWVTDSHQRITGYTVEEIGESNRPYHPDDQQLAHHDVLRTLKGEQTRREYRIITKSGEERWIHLHRFPVWDAGENRVVRFYGAVQDITERKHAEIKLRLSEERHRIISELISDWAYSYYANPDGNWKMEWMIGSPINLTGYDASELSGPLRVYHPEDDDRARHDVEQALQGKPTEGDYRIITRDGKVRWIHVRRQPVWDIHENRFSRFYAAVQDITERKRAEERFFKAFHSAPAPLGISTIEEGRFVDVNDSMVKLLGHMRDEMIGRSAIQLNTWADLRERAGILDILFEQGKVHERETRFRTKSGEIRDVLLSLEVIELEGQPHLLSLLLDITERKQAEIRLRQSEETLRQLSDAAFEGIGITADGKIILANRRLADMLGYEHSELPGKSVMDIVAPESRDLVMEHIRSEYDQPYEHLAIRKDGTVFPVEVYGRTMTFAGQQVRVTAVRDLTERKKAEQQALELAMEKERRALLTEFLANMSHDLKTPLSIINLSLSLLERLKDPAKQQDRLRLIQEQTFLVEKAIQDILTISRLDYAPSSTRTPVDVPELLRQVEKRLLPAAERKRLTVTFDVDANLTPILGDPDDLDRVMVNLVENALRYTPEGGSVNVHVYQESSQMVIAVKDTGIGISESDLAHIFERYYRAENARTLERSGTGLGLAIVKTIIEMHGGYVAVQSELRKGTTFRVYLPLVSSSANEDS